MNRLFLYIMCFGFSLVTVHPQDSHKDALASFVQEYDQDTILLRQPSKCRSYLVCNAEYSARRLCPDCEHFDPNLKRCTANRISVNCMGALPRCLLLRNGTISPHLRECTKYFVCVNGVAEENQCPSNSHYSEELGSCTNRSATVNDECSVENCKKSGQFVSHRFDYAKYCICESFINPANQPQLSIFKIETCPANESFDETAANCLPNFSEHVDRRVSQLIELKDKSYDINISNNFYCYKYRHCRIYEEECPASNFFSTKLQGCVGYEHSDCKYDYVKNELRFLILSLTVSLVLSFLLRKYFDKLRRHHRKMSFLLLNRLFNLKQVPAKSIENRSSDNSDTPNVTDALLTAETVELKDQSVIAVTV